MSGPLGRPWNTTRAAKYPALPLTRLAWTGLPPGQENVTAFQCLPRGGRVRMTTTRRDLQMTTGLAAGLGAGGTAAAATTTGAATGVTGGGVTGTSGIATTTSASAFGSWLTSLPDGVLVPSTCASGSSFVPGTVTLATRSW